MDVVSQFIKFTRYDENFVVRTGVSCQKHPHKIRAWCTIIPNLCHKVDLLLNNLLIFKFVGQHKGILKGQSMCHISTAANSNDKFQFIG